MLRMRPNSISFHVEHNSSTELARLEVFMMVLLKISVFWNVTPHRPVHIIIAFFTQIQFIMRSHLCYGLTVGLFHSGYTTIYYMLALHQEHLSLLGLIMHTFPCICAWEKNKANYFLCNLIDELFNTFYKLVCCFNCSNIWGRRNKTNCKPCDINL